MRRREAARALVGTVADLVAVVLLAVTLCTLAWGVARLVGHPLAAFTGAWHVTLRDGSRLEGRGEDSLQETLGRHAGAVAATEMVDDGVGVLRNLTVWALLAIATSLGAWAAFRQRGRLRHRLRLRLADAPRAIGAAAVTLLAATLLVLALGAAGFIPRGLDRLREGSPAWRLALLGMAGVLGPVAEELYFRGRLWDLWAPAVGERGALVVSSVAFAAAHGAWLTPLWPVTGLQIAMGLVLGGLRRRSGRLAPGMLAHVAHNTTALALLG